MSDAFNDAAGKSDAMEFSIDSMRSCSGNARCDLPYAQWFCKKARDDAQAACRRLREMADLARWSDNVRAECESLRSLVVAHHVTLEEFAQFFDRKPEMAAPFRAALPEIAELRKAAMKASRTISGWLEVKVTG